MIEHVGQGWWEQKQQQEQQLTLTESLQFVILSSENLTLTKVPTCDLHLVE